MTHQAQTAAEKFCRGLYSETEAFFDKIGHPPKFGFKILNGLPLKNAPYLFIGFQPGGGSEDYKVEIKKGTDKGWPQVCEYATEEWRLADRMRKVFRRELLEKCVGTNAIFLRYPNILEYRRDVGVKRKDIEKFCIDKVSEIVKQIDPQQIVAIGFATLGLFGKTTSALKSESGRTLTKTGTIAGRPAVGIIHLSGSRISNEDMDLLSSHFGNSPKPTS